MTLSPDRKSAVLIDERGADLATFSPDGKWIAYRSGQSGRSEVYVQTLPVGGGKWRISNSGGSEPFWRGDGKELFYMNGSALMAATIQPAAGGLEHGMTIKLFEAPVTSTVGRNRFVATADGKRFLGKRFLIVTAAEQMSSARPLRLC